MGLRGSAIATLVADTAALGLAPGLAPVPVNRQKICHQIHHGAHFIAPQHPAACNPAFKPEVMDFLGAR